MRDAGWLVFFPASARVGQQLRADDHAAEGAWFARLIAKLVRGCS